VEWGRKPSRSRSSRIRVLPARRHHHRWSELHVNQSGGCTYSLAPGSHSASASGGASSVAVNTAAGCEWTSRARLRGSRAYRQAERADDDQFHVAANSDRRRASATSIGGQTFSVMQAAVACSYSLNPTSYSASAGGPSSFA
jgi:hypothetical protein